MKTTRSRSRVDNVVVTGLGAATLTFLLAEFEGDAAAADRVVQTFGADLLLQGVTSVLRSSIAPEDRLAFLAQLSDDFIGQPRGAAAFVRGI